MKFLCSHCKAKYQIADEKVAGRTLRMTCRNCQQEIMIRGDVPPPAPLALARRPLVAPPAPAPSPLGADFQRQVGASLHAPPLPSPIDEWHVGINDVPVGPMRREEVARKLASGAIHPDSLAWREGLDDWLPIRNIAELAVLCTPGMSMAPPPLVSAAQRTEFAPVGGRAGALPSYAVEDWAQVSAEPLPMQTAVPMQTAQTSVNPMMSAEFVERRGGMPSVSVMFALAGGLAFMMTLSAIFGARWLQGGQNNAATKAETLAVPAVPATQAPGPVAPSPAAAPAGEMVIGVDDPALRGDGSNAARPRGVAGTQQSGKASGTSNGKKELTDEQKAMLARMGGGDAPSSLNLRSQTATGGSDQRGGTGTLSAKDVSDVVVRGRQNLQRCYETALRGSGSTDAVRISVELTVSAAGNVANLKTTGDGLPGMAQCIERTVRMWRFPKSGGDSPVKFPLVFQPGS